MRHVTSWARPFAARRKWLMVLPCIALLAAGVITTAAGAKTAAPAASAKNAAAPHCTSTSTAKYNLIHPGQLTVAVIGAAQPFVSLNKAGTDWVGLEPDFVRYAAKLACIPKVVFVEQEFSSLLADVANRKYDIGAAGIGDTPEREKTLNFVCCYLGGYIAFVGKTGSTIHGLSDLAGKRVGVITGSVEETILKTIAPQAQVVEFPDVNSQVQALLSDQVDANFMDTGTDKAYIKQYPQLAELFLFKPTAFGKGNAWPISKKDTVLRAALQRSMNTAICTGFVTHLFHKWLNGLGTFYVPIKPKC